eukprot:1152554-Pelagomonas_calceolata.AAC.3
MYPQIGDTKAPGPEPFSKTTCLGPPSLQHAWAEVLQGVVSTLPFIQAHPHSPSVFMSTCLLSKFMYINSLDAQSWLCTG